MYRVNVLTFIYQVIINIVKQQTATGSASTKQFHAYKKHEIPYINAVSFKICAFIGF